MSEHADWFCSTISNDDADLAPELRQMLTSHEPSALGDRISRELDNYSVAFITSKEGERSPAGSGTLISFRNSKYILTAAHVWHGDSPDNGLKNADSILIPIKEGEPKRLTFNPTELIAFGPEIPRGWNQWGPDLVALSLPPDRIGSLQAVGRSFYNLSKQKEHNVEGVQTHFLVGAPAQRGDFTAGKAIPEMQAMLIWKATGSYLRAGLPHPMRQDFDYIDLGINTNAPHVAKRFGGVSGGGIWTVWVYRSGIAGFESFKFLNGIAYWEEPFDESNLLMVRCHGPQSIRTVLRYLPD
jgi:hypothetical protein